MTDISSAHIKNFSLCPRHIMPQTVCQTLNNGNLDTMIHQTLIIGQ
jgi:hypothetical protein